VLNSKSEIDMIYGYRTEIRMDKKLERILSKVEKPARYTGGEYGAYVFDKSEIDTRIAFCFPDVYEIGMSNLGMKILYGLNNEVPGVWCERVFAPWPDMEHEMRSAGLKLFGLESGDPIDEFDLICFTLQYEMSYTNILNMLDLAGLPVRSQDRRELKPVVMAGGSCAFNAEPLAPFIDLFVLGEGEEVNLEVLECYRAAKREGVSKKEFLKRAAQIKGVYVPEFYEVDYHADGRVRSVRAREGAPEIVEKRIIRDLDKAYYPVKTVVPSTEIVHDRVMLEVFRGCIRGCRFCQAGYIYRPVREKSADALIKTGIDACKLSGYEEISLSSLSTSDYRHLEELCDGLLDWCEPNNTNLSLPSLRADNFSFELMERVQKVRKSGLTFAPEAGSQRLRDAINKNVREEDLAKTCRIAFEGGYNTLKLYFMIGLPTETDEDVIEIARLAYRMHRLAKETSTSKRGVKITVSVSCFVPKPHTPFQWEAQNTIEEFERKQELLRAHMPRAVNFSWHDPRTSYIEAVFARGDRRLADALEEAWRSGCRFDGWGEYFSFEKWMDAFRKTGLDPDFYAARERDTDEVLPWDHLSCGVSRNHLLRERSKAYRSEITPDCRVMCTGCGANKMLEGGVCDA